MLAVTTYTPQAGMAQVVNLLLQSGYIEVINDSNYLLTITFHTGTVFHPPGMVQMYPCPTGGGTITLLPPTTTIGAYMNADGGPSNNVVINQYLEDEIAGGSYPYFIQRASNVQNPLYPLIETVTASNLASAMFVTVAPIFINTYLYIYGYDLSIDQESSAHQYKAQVTGVVSVVNDTLNSITLTNTYHSLTAGAIQERWRPPYGIRAVNQGGAITVTVPAVSGSTASASLQVYCGEF